MVFVMGIRMPKVGTYIYILGERGSARNREFVIQWALP